MTNLSPTRPERIISFEVGYKSVLLNNKLVVDIDAYTNKYDGFLGQVEVAVPASDKVGTDASVMTCLRQTGRSKRDTGCSPMQKTRITIMALRLG